MGEKQPLTLGAFLGSREARVLEALVGHHTSGLVTEEVGELELRDVPNDELWALMTRLEAEGRIESDAEGVFRVNLEDPRVHAFVRASAFFTLAVLDNTCKACGHETTKDACPRCGTPLQREVAA